LLNSYPNKWAIDIVETSLKKIVHNSKIMKRNYLQFTEKWYNLINQQYTEGLLLVKQACPKAKRNKRPLLLWGFLLYGQSIPSDVP